jgi:LCP family protein required for cell wall assembly
VGSKKKYVVPAPAPPDSTAISDRADSLEPAPSASSQSAAGRKKYVVAPPEHEGRHLKVRPRATGNEQIPSGSATKGALESPKSRSSPRLRRVLRWISWAVLVSVVFAMVYSGALLWRFDSSMKRVGADTSAALAPGGFSATNILISGSDSRQGNNTFVPGDEGPGLSDVVMILQVRWTKAKLLSIPRDTRVILGRFGEQKINAALPLGGPPLLIQAVSDLTGLRIHRYMAVDFAGFVELTDSLGGVELCLDNAERDSYSGLSLPAGCQNVGGEQALAYVRSRHTEISQNGKWVADTGGDFSRMKRQQRYFEALGSKLKSPTTMLTKGWSVSRKLGDALTADRSFRYYTEMRVALAMAWSKPETYSLPGVPLNKGGVSYVEINRDEARAILDNFRS